jgi:hypothetical protein
MAHGAGFAPAGWQGWAVMAAFVLAVSGLGVGVFRLVADPLLAGVAFGAVAGALAVGLLALARRLARGG